MLILKKKRVRFRYFEETKTEIDLFFLQKQKKSLKEKYFFKGICLRLSILLIIVLITYSVTKYVKADVANTVSIVVTVVGIVISCVDIVKNVFNNREE